MGKNIGKLDILKWIVKAVLCSAGLIGLVVAYSIMGAFIFRALENNYSQQNIEQLKEARQTVVKKLAIKMQKMCVLAVEEENQDKNKGILFSVTERRNLTENMTVPLPITPPPDNTTLEERLAQISDNLTLSRCKNMTDLKGIMSGVIEAYEEQMTRHNGWQFTWRDDSNLKEWSLAEALLYSVTVITTIGKSWSSQLLEMNHTKIIYVKYTGLNMPNTRRFLSAASFSGTQPKTPPPNQCALPHVQAANQWRCLPTRFK
jgi:hypothetical protein